LEVVVRLALAAVLAFAAVSKLAAPWSSQAALATFGIPSGRARWVAWAVVVATELGLAAGVAAGSDVAAWCAAGLLAGFAAVLAVALARGRSGAPCACFGSRSRVTRAAVGRNLALAVAFAALPWVPEAPLDRDGWLLLGLAVALAGVAILGVFVLALAREVGLLRLQLVPQAALEIPGEGPPVGEWTLLANRFDHPSRARLALAVFSSPGCRLCRSLEPAVASLQRDPVLSVEVFDEELDVDVWRELGIPGSPFAIVLDRDGIVRAKGTFNNLAQLEGLLAAAERRLQTEARA
jgi:Methylamine utilisation protein MauE